MVDESGYRKDKPEGTVEKTVVSPGIAIWQIVKRSTDQHYYLYGDAYFRAWTSIYTAPDLGADISDLDFAATAGELYSLEYNHR